VGAVAGAPLEAGPREAAAVSDPSPGVAGVLSPFGEGGVLGLVASGTLHA
jgi:hypothetical protein